MKLWKKAAFLKLSLLFLLPILVQGSLVPLAVKVSEQSIRSECGVSVFGIMFMYSCSFFSMVKGGYCPFIM